MLNSFDIVRLYNTVLINDVRHHQVKEKDIKRGIREMSEVYMPNKENWMQEVSRAADYYDVSHRCAYLHKYAPLHTAMVQELFGRILNESDHVYDAMNSGEKCMKICSLGGGPGTDVIGVISAIHHVFGLQACSVQVVDLMSEWEYTFQTILDELSSGDYGSLSGSFYPYYFNHSYISADLLGSMTNDVNKAIASANLITMIKFVSAATCIDTETMIRKIFNSMKPGALVLFIDNAAGGFSELISRVGQQCHLFPVFGPLDHEYYGNPIFNMERYGYVSCSETIVTVHVLKKSFQNLNILSSIFHDNQNMDIPQSHIAPAAYPIHSTESYLEDFPPLQPNNQQSLLLPPTGFKVENNWREHTRQVKSEMGGHTWNIESISNTDYQSSYSFSSESPSSENEEVGLRISNSNISNEKSSPFRTTNVINNYDTQVSTVLQPANTESINYKEFDTTKNGFVEVLSDIPGHSNAVPEMNTAFKQYIPKGIKSYQTSISPKSKDWRVPVSGEGYERMNQNLSNGKVISSATKPNVNTSLISSLSSYYQTNDLLATDNTKNIQSLPEDGNNSEEKGWFLRTISIIGRFLCCAYYT